MRIPRGQGTRVRFEERDGKKVRVAARSGELSMAEIPPRLGATRRAIVAAITEKFGYKNA